MSVGCRSEPEDRDNPVVQVPTTIFYGGRSGAPVALIAATAATTILFAATPFLLSPIADRYGISEGLAGAVSIAQVGAFAVANFLFPRIFRPSGRILRGAAASLVVFNAASMVPGTFAVLVMIRVLAGLAAGTMTWLAWTSAMKRSDSMASIAATGPVVALVAAPILSVVASHGDRAVYGLLAVAAIPAAVLIAPVSGRRRQRGVISRSRSNRALLAALATMTFFGSALFINEAIVARDVHHLSALASSIAFSLNAAGGLVGARWSRRHRHPGWYLASIGPAALLSVIGPVPFFYLGMTWWGFAFWMGVPGVLQMLSDRSLEPSERAGDGQGLMALGRAGGPALGGLFVDAGSLNGLALTSAVGLSLSGLAVVGVKEGRDRLPPTDPRTIDQQ
jgi:predicted MFS family arabinose efflux permease